MALIDKLTAIADAIRAKTGKSDTLTLDEMPTEIESIETSGGEEPDSFLMTGNGEYAAAYGFWDEVIKFLKNKIQTADITNCQKMFDSSKLEEIPFDINCKSGVQVNLTNMFSSCEQLKSVPKINNCTVLNASKMFQYCRKLRTIPSDFANWFDWSYMEGQTTSTRGDRSQTFSWCESLRYIPADFLSHGNPYSSNTTHISSSGFTGCASLDEIVGLFANSKATWTSNGFGSAFDNTNRIKRLTFAMQSNGTPYVVNWKSQYISLHYSGYGKNIDYNNSNSGITDATKIVDDDSYQALKDNIDSWTADMAYSRYNHDSAVETINSLPDTSAYINANSGTNTIRFRGSAGSKTDGGAINTLTEEEIAVATAKGWTVTFI
jgi:hypothetical protein